MGAKDVLTRKTGVIVGDDVLNLFKYAKDKGFAIPAIVIDYVFLSPLDADGGRMLLLPQPLSLPWKLLVMQMRRSSFRPPRAVPHISQARWANNTILVFFATGLTVILGG